MVSTTAAAIPELKEFLQQYPSIELYTPEDEKYEAVREYFVIRTSRPSAIVRPQTAEDVEVIVKFCVKHNLDFSIRGGGHDCAGRSQVDGALTVDMRDINYVHVEEGNATARVGGGVLLGQLVKDLGEHGLVTACGTIATVGYAGWATLGGYGPFSSLYGMGVDQIVGARLVNAQGDIIDANEELLKGIRGGGGSFGVIVELTIKVFPLKELLLSTIVYESSILEAALLSYTEGYQKLLAEGNLPRALQIQPVFIEFPQVGKVFGVLATWADADHDEGRRWFDIIAGLGNCIMNSPQPISVHQYTVNNEQIVSWPSYGRCFTISVKQLTQKTARILAKYGSLLPGGGAAISIHTLRSPRASDESVFGSRVDHHMIEMVAVSGDETYASKAAEWGSALLKELKEDAENILESSYISLLEDSDTDLKKVYGSHYDTLLGLKKKYDPHNVFKHAIPKISV